MSKPELAPGERIILAKAASLLVELGGGGTSPSFNVGGRLYLTNRRIWFKTHALNFATGIVDRPLASLTSCTDVSAGLYRMMKLEGGNESCVFVVWGIPRILSEIEAARSSPESHMI